MIFKGCRCFSHKEKPCNLFVKYGFSRRGCDNLEKVLARKAFIFGFSFYISSFILSFAERSIAVASALIILAALIATLTLLFIFRKRSLPILHILSVSLLAMLVASGNILLLDKPLPEKYLNTPSNLTVKVGENLWNNQWSNTYKAKIVQVGEEETNITAVCVFTGNAAQEGDIIAGTSSLIPLSDSPLSYTERYLRSKGINAYAEIEDAHYTEQYKDLFTYVRELRSKLSSIIRLSVEGDEGELCTSLFTGDRSRLPKEITRDFTDIGASHILAISGLHLTVLFYFFSFLTSKAGSLRRRNILNILVILFYMGIAGFSASVVRAGVMLIISCAAQMYGREADLLTTLGESVVIICIVDRYAVFDIGFTLSVASVFAVAIISRLLRPVNQPKAPMWRKILFSVLSPLVMSVAINIVILPVISVFYPAVSLMSPLSNLILVPAVTLLLYLIPCIMILSPIPILTNLIGFFCKVVASAVIALADKMSSVSGILISARYPGLVPISIAITLCLVLLSVTKRKKTSAVATVLCVILAFSSVTAYEYLRCDTVGITPISDGKNDMLIVRSGGHFAVVDIGNTSKMFIGECTDILAEQCAGEIDLYALTEYKKKSPDCLKSLLSKFRVESVYLPKPANEDEEYIFREMCETVETWGKKLITNNDSFTFGMAEISTEKPELVRIKCNSSKTVYMQSGIKDHQSLLQDENASSYVFGSYGKGYSGNIELPERFEADNLIFLGNSTDYFPPDVAISMYESGTMVNGSGYTISCRVK